MNDADLTKTNLSDVDLTGADLTYANLSEAKLSGANLSEANLSEANLSGADLADVKGVTNEELEQEAKSLKGTIMPNGQKYEEWLKDKEGR